MNYEVVENEIVERLKTDELLSSIADVMLLPDSVSDYQTPTVYALVTVVFLGEKFDNNQSIGQVSQHSSATFNVSVQARKLRGERGVYQVSELVKKLLIGFVTTDCGMLTLGEHLFTGYQNDVWEHSITFSANSLRTQEDYQLITADASTMIDDEIFYTKKTVNENIHLQR